MEVTMESITLGRANGWWDYRDAIEDGLTFTNTSGSFYSTDRFGGYGRYEPTSDEEREHLLNADYIVYSYDTPIAWRFNGEWTKNDLDYSTTTRRHQNKVFTAITEL